MEMNVEVADRQCGVRVSGDHIGPASGKATTLPKSQQCGSGGDTMAS